MSITEVANTNFEQHLRQNSYPGRGLVVGRSTENDDWLLIYWIMGRSRNSQNRRFVIKGTTLRTEPVDPALVEDPSLIIYEAMLDMPGRYLVSNGDQTRTLYETLTAGGTFDEALAQREREPDAPNYTPRISAMLSSAETLSPAETRTPTDVTGPIAMSILKANPANPDLTDRFTFRPAPPPPGLGYGLTTYQGDGNPLLSFSGDPLVLPCQGTPEAVLDAYWNALNADNRISLAVKVIPAAGEAQILVRNRFGDVG